MSKDTLPKTAVSEAADKYAREAHSGFPPTTDNILLMETRDHFKAGAAWQREHLAALLDDAAKHHLKQDEHPAFNRTRMIDADKCEDCAIGYHSFPGYAGHVLEQMAKVVRGQVITLRSEVTFVKKPAPHYFVGEQCPHGSGPMERCGHCAASPPKTGLRHQCERLKRAGVTMTDGAECPECGEHFPTRKMP